MPRRRPPVHPRLARQATEQGGVVTRAQAEAAGLSKAQVAARLATTWQRSCHAGVYVTFTGPLDYLTRCWAALLHAGPGAALCLESAAWVWDLLAEPPALVHVMTAPSRRPAAQDGVRFHVCERLAGRVHPARLPAVVRLEETVLDLVDRRGSSPDDVITVVLRVCQRRLTTPARLTGALSRRPKIRHRHLLLDLLTDAVDGVQSALERRYLRDVEQPHGLPAGRRNRTERTTSGNRYRDVRYPEFLACVELDGRGAHPAEEREDDDQRDNDLLLVEGTRTLRYGWRSVVVKPCRTAAQVGRLLQQGGWSGRPRPCGPDCGLAAS